MSKTPIPKESVPWKQGIPTPIQNTTSPNKQKLHLIAGFAMGQIQMKGDKVQYTSQTTHKSLNRFRNFLGEQIAPPRKEKPLELLMMKF